MERTKKIKILFLISIFFIALLAFPLSGSAEEKEAVSSQNIEQEVVETETGFYYTVKKGDTLWDLSQKFSNTPYLWPDLWSDNSDITNPHLIYPGQRIRLFRRRDIEKESKPVIQEKTIETKAPPLEVEPEEVPVIVTQEIPEAKPVSKTYRYRAIDSVGFIKRKALTPEGVIFKVKEDKLLISEGDIVYISQNKNNPLIPGGKYTVYRTLEPLYDQTTGRYIGIQHFLLGIVEITNTAPRFAIAKVTQSFSNMQVNDKLMPYKRRSANIVQQESKEGLLGKIIIAEKHSILIGDNTTAFINRGEDHGIKPGQQYSIFYQETSSIVPASRSKISLDAVIFGELIVLHTEKTTSTVYITSTNRQVAPGSKICTPIK
ncbi:MAG: LysM peptidoglycan-binding domain-containing protein [Desulfobacterales bacterium]|nr:LysM peptidoglycan-binding domain-containing protein [Deltaproteobacteria bacterium]NNL43343.1 LysM peptidoglycan-binding domain-containing protein [Desulfobacterales bacterium]